MEAVRWFAWVSFAASVLALGMAAAYEAPAFVGAAFSAALGGVLLLAVDRGLERLTEIRDALVGRTATVTDAAPDQPAPQASSTAGSLADLEKRLDALRK